MDMEANPAAVFCASKTNLICLLLSRLTRLERSSLSLWALEKKFPKAYVVPWPAVDGKDCFSFDCFSFLLPLFPAQVDQLLSCTLMMLLIHMQLVGWCNPSVLSAELLQSGGSPTQALIVISVSPELACGLELEAGFSSSFH